MLAGLQWMLNSLLLVCLNTWMQFYLIVPVLVGHSVYTAIP